MQLCAAMGGGSNEGSDRSVGGIDVDRPSRRSRRRLPQEFVARPVLPHGQQHRVCSLPLMEEGLHGLLWSVAGDHRIVGQGEPHETSSVRSMRRFNIGSLYD